MSMHLKIKEINLNIEKLEKCTENLNNELKDKIKKIDLLKEQIELNISKIDKILEKHNANS